ncbi:UNVERIFIED_ORG: hypothetical protein CLV66_12449 [Actinomadura viridilutea]|uniref:hypothetical protein n=1 Tax=Actinomadura rubrobrunea TaxID=115335 RepID=UPI000831B71A|nr:hypothetical protein [Actinomadura rubrobrunea]
MSFRRPAPFPRGCRFTGRRHRVRFSPQAVPAATARTAQFTEDDQLLLLLIAMWELRTARPAPTRPLQEMTEDELIEFWSEPDEDVPPADRTAPFPETSA